MKMRRIDKLALLQLGFILLFGFFGIRLATVESPDAWEEGDITVTEVRYISSWKQHTWRITDTEGNTYNTYESHIADEILPQSTYHMVWSPNGTHRNIRAVTQGNTVIMDYADSVSIYCERTVGDRLLAILGLAGAITTVVCMFADIRRERIHRGVVLGRKNESDEGETL